MDQVASHSGFTNVVSSIHPLSSDEIFPDEEPSKTGKRPMVNVFHALYRLPRNVKWLGSIAVLFYETRILIVLRNRGQPSWNRMPLSCSTTDQIWMIMKSWRKKRVCTWRQRKAEGWGKHWKAVGSLWLCIRPNAPRAHVVLTLCSTQKLLRV